MLGLNKLSPMTLTLTSLVAVLFLVENVKAGLSIYQKNSLRNFFDLYLDPKIKGEHKGYFNAFTAPEVYEELGLGTTGMPRSRFRTMFGGLLAIANTNLVVTHWNTTPLQKVTRRHWIALSEIILEEPETIPSKIQNILKDYVFDLILLTSGDNSNHRELDGITLKSFEAFYKKILPEEDKTSKIKSDRISTAFNGIHKVKEFVTRVEWLKSPLTRSFLSLMTLVEGAGECRAVKNKLEKGQLMTDWLENSEHLLGGFGFGANIFVMRMTFDPAVPYFGTNKLKLQKGINGIKQENFEFSQKNSQYEFKNQPKMIPIPQKWGF